MARLTMCGLVKLTSVFGLLTPMLLSTLRSVEMLLAAGRASMEMQGMFVLCRCVTVVEAPVTRTSDRRFLRTWVLLAVSK